MKTCPECGIALKDEYQFCPEDGASLADSTPPVAADVSASASSQAANAVVLYCPACAAEYPLTFSVCPVHQTALTTHGIPPLPDAPRAQARTAKATTEEASKGRRLHLVSAESQPHVAPPPAQPRRSGIEEYEQTLENLAQPAAGIDESDHIEAGASDPPVPDEGQKYRRAAIVISIALAVLALIGVYTVISNASRKPAQPAKKTASAKSGAAQGDAAQPAVTVQTPQAAIDYQEPTTASAASMDARDVDVAPRNDIAQRSAAPSDTPARMRRSVESVDAQPQRVADARAMAASREPIAAPAPHRAEPVNVAPAAVRQPAATELVLPRGTFGQVEARLTGVRASRSASGYRYDLTFHMADQAGHATQWERLAIVTRAASGASRQQQIPFYHRLGADGTLSFTVSVEMPGRAPADWQGRIICTSIGSDSTGKTYRASFGANVSPR